MKRSNHISFGDVGLFILMLCSSMIVSTTILWIAGFSITVVNGIVSLLMTITASYFFFDKKSWIKLTVISLFVIFLCVAVSNLIYDYSWDGNTYRKNLTFMLSHGYSPIYEAYWNAVGRIGWFKNIGWASFMTSGSRGSMVCAAVIYAVTGAIEYGKAFNVMMMVATFCIAKSLLQNLLRLKSYQAVLCGAAIAVNPVVLTQAITFYNDGSLGCVLCICVLCLTYLTLYREGVYAQRCYAMIFMTIGIGFTLKYTGLLYFAIYVAAFYFYWVYTDLRFDDRKDALKRIYRYSGFFSASVISGLLLFGFMPFVTNIKFFGTPLYRMVGESAVDIVEEGYIPVVLREESNTVRFFHSLFAESSNDGSGKIKIPFTFNKQQVAAFLAPDLRIGGWGVFFSGIFIISMIVILIFLFWSWKKNRQLFSFSFIILVPTFFLIPVVPGMFWARYYTHLFLIPLFALLIAFYYANNLAGQISADTEAESKSLKPPGVRRSLLFRIYACVFAAIILANNFPSFYHVQQYLSITAEVKDQLSLLRKMEDLGQTFQIRIVRAPHFVGPLINIIDAGVKNYTTNLELSDPDGQVYHRYPVEFRLDGEQMDALRKLEDYLPLLSNPDFLVLMSIRDEGTNALSPQALVKLDNLGLQSDFKGGFRKSYIAVIDGGNVVHEQMGKGELTYQGNISDVNFSIRSKGFLSAGSTDNAVASIKVGGKERAVNTRGLNIVVVDKVSGEVIDQVVFDTFESSVSKRKFCDSMRLTGAKVEE